MKTLFNVVVAVCCIWLLSGCSSQQEKQKEATATALKALGRVEAGTQVGVTFQQYGKAVIDAKSAVNEAERVLSDGDLRFYLSRAMRAYADASTVWNQKIQHPGMGFLIEPNSNLIAWYALLVKDREVGLTESDFKEVSPDVAMQLMWGAAAKFLTAARSLENKPNQDTQLSRAEAELERKWKEAEAKREKEQAEAARKKQEAEEEAARAAAMANAKREQEEAEQREREQQAEAERQKAEAKAKREKEQAEIEAQARREKEQAEQSERERQAEERARAARLKQQEEEEQARREADKARLRKAHLNYAKELLDTYGEDGPAKRAKGAERLAWIVKEYPGTDEAKEAAKLLEKIKKDGGP